MSHKDPLLFVTEVLQVTPEPWQADALNLIAKHDRVSIRSGHGVGKTALFGWLIPWFLLTRKDAVVPVTANSQDQLRDVVWPEVRRWLRRLPNELREQLTDGEERITLTAAPELGFAVRRTSSKERPEALQGFHARNLLFLIEEASGIPDEVFEVAQGALSTEGAKAVLVSNPTRLSGFFYDTHHRIRDRWATMRVNAEDVPRARGHIADIEVLYGKDSNKYKIRVKGDFPDSEEDQLIPLDVVEAAITRDVVESMVYRPIWGVDVGWTGDRSALAKRRHTILLEPIRTWHGKDPVQLAGRIEKEFNDTDIIDRPSQICIDSIGIGLGVVANLRLAELPGCTVRGINVAESPSAGQHRRLRDELWWKVREWFYARDCKIPRDDALIAELTAPTYDVIAGATVVEPKGMVKKRLGRSPDLADAFVLTMAGGSDRLKAETLDRYRRKPTRRKASAWAA